MLYTERSERFEHTLYNIIHSFFYFVVDFFDIDLQKKITTLTANNVSFKYLYTTQNFALSGSKNSIFKYGKFR